MGMKKGKPDHEISKNSIPRDNSYRLRAVRKQTNEDKKKRPLISQIKVFFFLFTNSSLIVVNSVCLPGHNTQKHFQTSLC